MENGGKRGAILFASVLLASVALQAMTASAQPPGRVRVDSDIEMFGVSDLTGGGHVTYTLTGDVAIQLRERLLALYDANTQIPPGFPFDGQLTQGDQEGDIDAAEVLTFANHVENYVEGVTPAGEQTFQYARLRRMDVLEDDTIQGIQLSTEGLIGVPVNSLQNVVMKFIFESSSRARLRTYDLADPVFVEALYYPFGLEIAKSFEGPADIFLSLVPEDFVTQGSWVVTNLEPGPSSSQSFWVGGDPATGMYLPDSTNVTYADLDLSTVESANLSFWIKGQVASGDRLEVEVRPQGGSWDLLDVFMGQENTWDYQEYDLSAYLGERVRVRFNFTSDATNEASGYFIDDFRVVGSAAYAGAVSQGHTDYLVGVMSFSGFEMGAGSAHYIRTPGGVILTQTVDYSATSPPSDRMTFSSFDFVENPQVLFILIVVCAYVLSAMQNRFYSYYRASHPSRYRGRAVKIRWLHLLGLLMIILYILFYFFPSLFVFAGAKAYITGAVLWVFAIATTVGLSIASKLLYDRAIDRIPPPPAEAAPRAPAAVGAGLPPGVALPPPPPPVGTFTCSVCNQDIDDEEESVRCACGNSFHPLCASEAETCPNCGRELPEGVGKPKKMISVKCPACGELGLVEEDADLARTKCEACGIILQEVETGYNYLIIDDHPAIAYEQFKSVLSRNIPGLCFSTVFPEKLSREYGLEGAELYWISDTSSDQRAVDPKRLDFELMRAFGNFVKNYPGSTVMLDGLEYLVVENGFDRVLKFVKKINDLASVNDCTLFVPITPTSLGGDEISMLRKEFDRVGSYAS